MGLPSKLVGICQGWNFQESACGRKMRPSVRRFSPRGKTLRSIGGGVYLARIGLQRASDGKSACRSRNWLVNAEIGRPEFSRSADSLLIAESFPRDQTANSQSPFCWSRKEIRFPLEPGFAIS